MLLVADSSTYYGISMVPAALLACLNFLFYMQSNELYFKEQNMQSGWQTVNRRLLEHIQACHTQV
jgi:hypothetical protein